MGLCCNCVLSLCAVSVCGVIKDGTLWHDGAAFHMLVHRFASANGSTAGYQVGGHVWQPRHCFLFFPYKRETVFRASLSSKPPHRMSCFSLSIFLCPFFLILRAHLCRILIGACISMLFCPIFLLLFVWITFSGFLRGRRVRQHCHYFGPFPACFSALPARRTRRVISSALPARSTRRVISSP